MTAAPTYNRLFNFTNFQALAPASPLPAIPLDSELSSIKVTLDALITNAALIQRSDGALANQSVGPQQLQPSLLTGISPPTQWSGAGVSYDVGATVFSGLLFYVCNAANISSTGNPPATFAAWTFLADFSGVTIPAGSITSAAFAPGAVNSAALGAGLALSTSPNVGDNSTAIATTAFVDAQITAMLTAAGNRLINGAMMIDQRNSGAAGTANAYTADRWKYGTTQVGKITWQRQTTTPPAGFPDYLNFAAGSFYTVLSTDVFVVVQTIEGGDISDFQWGTAGALPVTLSFWVVASASGQYAAALRNGATTRSYPFLYTIAAPNVWQEVTATVPGDTGGTWLNSGSGAGLSVSFDLGSGATFKGTANTWQAGNFFSVAAATAVAATAGATLSITGVALQLGVGAPLAPFGFRPAAQEVALCQRYYETVTGDTFACNVTSANAYFKFSAFVVHKRATPAMVYSGITATNFSGGISTSSPLATGVKWGSTASGTGYGTLQTTWTADADF